MTGATNAGSAPVVASDLSAIAIIEPSAALREGPRGDVEGCRARCPGEESGRSRPRRAALRRSSGSGLCRLYPGGRIQCLRATELLCRLLRATQGLNDFLVRHGDGARFRRPASCLRVGSHQPGDGAVHRAGIRSGILAAPPHREEREGAAAGLIRETGYAIHAYPGSKRTHLWGIELSDCTCCTDGVCDACRACASSWSTRGGASRCLRNPFHCCRSCAI